MCEDRVLHIKAANENVIAFDEIDKEENIVTERRRYCSAHIKRKTENKDNGASGL